MKKCFVMVLLCCLLVAGTAFAKTGTLLVAFGTSMDSARPAIDDIEKAYKKAAGNDPCFWPSPRTSSGTSWPRKASPSSPSTPR